VGDAKVIKGAGLSKGVLINKGLVGKAAGRIVRGTKLPIGGAGLAAGDAVAVAKPGPPDRISDRDICGGRRERETI